MQLQPMLQVADVESASQWFQHALGLQSGHGGAEFEMLFAGKPHETPLLLMLHRWEAHEHGELGRPELPRGNGCSLWFQVDDKPAFDAAWERMKPSEVLKEPAFNELAHHEEFSVETPDGYVVVVHTPAKF